MSSVRRGLEGERDALPGLVLGLGHEPTRFEVFGSLPVPSREACLRGVENADAYLLLLGEHCGDPLPDTGKSPTEKERTVPKRRGIPILVFRKQGITLEPEQAEFIRRVEDYVEGRFRGSFVSVGELLGAAGKAIRALDARPASLAWKLLASAVTVRWHTFPRGPRGDTLGTVLEVHVLPTKGKAHPRDRPYEPGQPPRAGAMATGYCWVELGAGVVGFAGGDFFAAPDPVVELRRPGRAWHAGKVLFERYWFGGGVEHGGADAGLPLGSALLRVPARL